MSEEMQKAYCPACGFDVATPVTRFTSAPSPFFILITTNGRVSTSDDDLLSHYLQRVRADISAQDDVIRRIKSALTRAENEKNRLQGIFDSHAALRSPFRRCPPEVLTEIFHWTIATPRGDHLSLRELNARLSRVLSAVCRLWRTTVLSNPSLWARFRLLDQRNEGLMPLLQTVLDRSCDANLSIYCHSKVDVDTEEGDAFARRALGTSQQWKHARIELSTESSIDIYAQIRGRLPRLEWLELGGYYLYDVSWSGPRIDAFEDAPQLRALVLDGRIPVQKLALPWTQIISLDIKYVIRDNLSMVLSMTPNVQVLTLDYQEIDGRTDGWKPKKSEDIATCPSLRRVHVYNLALFRFFNLPSLEELGVKDLASAFGEGKDDKAEDIFHDFLERSGSPIKKLKLAVRTDVTDFPRTFDMAFRLVDLDITLRCPATATLFFRALLSTGDKTDVLPELRSLKAECRTVTHVKDLVEVDDIADMIVSRYHPPNAAVAEIQSVHITLPCLSPLRRQSFQARLKNLPDLFNLISTRDEIYTSFICMVR
ncbi:hypothetical protein ARMSODRAFT_957345 [Armillaria solidipes]|uniref:Uncharacterized protein n=1 Tax=Armillaria solidipes TaxID=1076256 RepID=A0A2H3BDU6_9AGAR|nr:hypothetical protein ARMSODRAFT_957345 [Armillaria solidipes]